jgi:CRISPR/Cas system CSM-associated protein Csm3 (group 7 of RAMP superfamily)
MSSSFPVLSDPGGVRPVVARWAITSELILETAAHLGGGRGSVADMTLIRDVRTGMPILPGTSIAGALRSHLADLLGGYRSQEDRRVALLFGAARGDDLGSQSPLIVFDSFGTLPNAQAIEIRDGVQIDAARGTAENSKKFDLEVLPAGTSFPIRFDLVVPSVDEEPMLLSLLAAALDGLSSGDIALGSRRSRGLGAVRTTEWHVRRHDLSTREGWLAWLLLDNETGSTACAQNVREACARLLGDAELIELQDHRRRVVIDAELVSTGGLLIRSAPAVPDAPDAVHLRSAGRSVLPGTSVAGALRNQAGRIAAIVRADKGDAEQWIEELFGPRTEGLADAVTRQIFASRLRVTESVVDNGMRSRVSRVRIDRFTSGVVPGALFDEELEQGGRVRVRLELREPISGQLGLILLVLKDLLTGELAVGGTSSVGRGRFRGTARMLLEDGRPIELDPNRSVDPFVNKEIQRFWAAPVLGGAS